MDASLRSPNCNQLIRAYGGGGDTTLCQDCYLIMWFLSTMHEMITLIKFSQCLVTLQYLCGCSLQDCPVFSGVLVGLLHLALHTAAAPATGA